MKRSVWLVTLLLIAAPLLAARNSPEKWWDAYKRGVNAVNAKSYDAAAEALQKCINEMPNESTSARARNEIITYVPHFWLGIAKFNLGDVEGALREWKTSEEQGAIQNTDYYSRLKDWVARGNAERLRNAQGAASESKKAADAAISKALSGQMEALSAGGDRTESYRSAQRKLQEALNQFHKAGTDVKAYAKAGDTAAQARELFVAAAEEGKKAKASRTQIAAKAPAPQPQQQRVTPQPVPPSAQPVVEPVKTAPTPAPVVAAATPPPTPVESEDLVSARVALQKYKQRVVAAGMQRRSDGEYQSALRRAADNVNQLAGVLKNSPDSPTAQRVLAEVASRERELTALLIAPPPTVATPVKATVDTKALLQNAYRAFAVGDLDTSEEMLTQILGASQSGEAYLLRGCARYTKAVLSGQAGAQASAESDFRTALRINKSLRLDKSVFSPKLVEFFDKVRNGKG